MSQKDPYLADRGLLDTHQLAVAICRDITYIRKLAKAGRIPAHRVGKRWYFKLAEVQAVIYGKLFDGSLALDAEDPLAGL